jgi:hypothetical protein
MIETIFGWMGFTSTAKYLVVLAQVDALKEQIFWLKIANIGFQFVLVALAIWAFVKFWKFLKPSKKAEKSKEEEKKEGS